ncbi:MAG: toxin co-regulated pilus biosynthesis Q family protein [Rickettsiales bacterium]|nr:toxin co-regulated pilus biosynthesis Q family protein [Rickettsiales bacterium]
MRKILAFALYVFAFAPAANADWSMEAPVPSDRSTRAPADAADGVGSDGGFGPGVGVGLDNGDVWPEQGSEGWTDLRAADSGRGGGNAPAISDSRRADGWTGGPGYTPPGGNPPVVDGVVPDAAAKMPLATKDLIVDDGSRALSASSPPGNMILDPMVEFDLPADEASDMGARPDSRPVLRREVSDWIAREGATLREVLSQWCDIEGWELVWNTKREYPLKASALFQGRFKDVSAALVRTFERAFPSPHAKYFNGNKVLVISTLEEHDGN